jgi:2-dehydropantoate 2-reductase
VAVPLIGKLKPDDCYDLVLVVMRKNKALEALPVLAANHSTLFLFLMNNAAGPDALIEALGPRRVLTGFAGAAGFLDGHRVVFINGEPGRPALVYLGEPLGGSTPRVEQAADALRKGSHISTEIIDNMDAWCKCHVALLFPALATSLYLCGNDNFRMANTPDALLLAWRGINEVFTILKKLKIPILPAALKKWLLLPEPLAVWLAGKLMANPRMEVAMARHARVIRDEIMQLNTEFLQLADKSGAFTPTLRFLIHEYNRQAPTLPEGSASLKMNWGRLVLPVLLALLAALTADLIF